MNKVEAFISFLKASHVIVSFVSFYCLITLQYQVETAIDSAPSLSLLAPLDFGSQYWKAPPSASSVEFGIVLGDLSDVNGVLLIVSPCGYSLFDAPIVSPHFPCVLVFIIVG